MVHFDPAWFEAAGTGIVAAETGVAMLNKKRAAESAAPAPVAITVNGITGQDLLVAVLILAVAMLAAALIIHHGLVA